MNIKDINISKIIANHRREKGLTQDQLAAYMGVSKASVSKWETGQSYPDITFLPQLATYFNISIDTLMGYTPQLTKEDIRNMYHRLSSDFSKKPFEEVLKECRDIIKKYYSCFPLLMQMAVLLCNHHVLAREVDEQTIILEEAVDLCIRIKKESNDLHLTKDAVSLEAACYLMLKQPQNVFELLGETIRPIANDDAAIAQAYLMEGNLKQANKVLQITIYQHLLSMIGASVTMLQLQNEQFEETLNRILKVAEAYDLEKLNPNIMALTYLNGAYVYVVKGEEDRSLDMLQKYMDLCINGFFPYTLHGDSYFSELDSWFEEFDLGSQAPRSEEVIKESMIQGIVGNPAFANLLDHPRCKNMIRDLELSFGGKVNEQTNGE